MVIFECGACCNKLVVILYIKPMLLFFSIIFVVWNNSYAKPTLRNLGECSLIIYI